MHNSTSKEKIGCDVICKSHSARTERDLYRICPSKLSKRELEDLYFALLENNLELKKTVNVQQDKIKLLSTRVQRISGAHRNGGREKDCCGSRALVNEQKESISDLKKTNERMAERIRVLNMRLCSAKQFLKRTPSSAATKACTRCSFKNSSLSALNAKQSDPNVKTTAVLCQFTQFTSQFTVDKDVSATTSRTVETRTEIPERDEPERLCNENKCRTMMDELKEKIVNLQEELSTTHDEYSSRLSKLEGQVRFMQEENVRVRSDRASSEHALLQRGKRADELAHRLRGAGAKCNELNMELTIEKRKVAELETGLKLANMSDPLAKTIEQLTALNEGYKSPSVVRDSSVCSQCSQKALESSPSSNTQLHPPSSSPIPKGNVKYPKSDDSGFADLNKSCEADEDSAILKQNQELLRKIAELQTQLDTFRISTAGETAAKQDKPKELECLGVEIKDVDETRHAVEPSDAMVPSSVENQEQEELCNMIEKDTDIERQCGKETEAACSKPWEPYLVTGRSEKEYVENDDNAAESSINGKETDGIDRSSSRDNDNRYQIPGPLPVEYPPPDKSNKRKSFKNSRDSFNERLKNKKANSEEKTVKIFENSKDSYFYSDKQSKEELDKESKMKNSALISNLKDYAKDLADIGHKNDVVEKKVTNKSVSITDVEAKLADRTPTRDSLMVNRKKLATRSASEEMDENGTETADGPKDSTTSFFLKCASAVHEVASDSNKRAAERATQVEPNADCELCESHAVICRCPILAKRDVAVFRSCSGTLRFRTTALSDKLRRCGCQVQTDSYGTQMDPPACPRRDSATYTAPAPAAERATSPDNTEHEISSLTDLPSERDGKSPRAVLSPGEEKATMTYTDTETMRTDYGSLSEGELPTERARRFSTGERGPDPPPSLVSSQKMEATLQSISEELARCRQLLLSQRPQEPSLQQRRASTVEEVHALRPSAARRRIAGTRAPSCVFTLHIGTLVLSDEAVLYSRDKPLVLMWQFYSQNATMTRVQTGRVVILDFATEYDVPFDENFLDYMKHEDMSIVLCEITNQEEPLAVCLLPLREALLHTNRRADMSLALVPTLSPGSARDAVGEEIGVLDLWCSLRVETSLLSIIHRAMHTPSPPSWHISNPLRSESRMTTFDPSDGRISRDLDLALTGKQPRTAARQPLTDDMDGHRKYSEDVPASIPRDPSCRYDDEVQQYRTSNKPYRRRSSQTQKSIPSSDLGHKGQVGFEANWPSLRQESSGIITNEVPVHIRSTEDLKHALEKNVHQRSIDQLPKMDEQLFQSTSQAQPSISSVKTLAAKHQLSKLRCPKTKWSREHNMDSIQELLKKEKDFTLGGAACQLAASTEGYVRDGSDGTLNKRNQNISIGLNKLVEAAKKTVKYTDSTTRRTATEEPQKENSADSDEGGTQSIVITILWLALNEECEAMVNPNVQRLYVAYSFLGRRGADLETPYSLPKPRHYADKCYFNFKKTFHLHECDLPLLGHMSRCRAGGGASTDPRDCLVFTLISEPLEDPLGLSSCEDIGYAYLYLGDVLAYSGGSGGYTEVIGVRGVRGGVCGVLAVRVDNLPVLRRALTLSHSQRDLARGSASSTAPLPAPSSTMPLYRIE